MDTQDTVYSHPPLQESSSSSQEYNFAVWSRLGAFLIDLVILIIISFLFNLLFSTVMTIVGLSQASIMISANIFGFVIGWLYYAIQESSEKQATFGKAALHLSVTDLEGKRISFTRATGRYFAKFISTFIFLIGYIMILFTGKKQGLHDIMAACLVLKNKK